MSRRHWAAILVVAAIAAIAAMLHPCASVSETKSAATPAAIVTRAATATRPAAAPRHRSAAPEQAPEPNPADAEPPTAERASVVVRVTDGVEEGPVAAITILLVEERPDEADVEHRAVTDADGAARFKDIRPGSVSARAVGDEWVRSDWTGGTAEPGTELSLELTLDRGTLLAGVVLDARTGRPVSGAAVEVILGGSMEGFGSSGTSAPPLGNLTTAEDGRFRLRVPAGQMVTPTASARGLVANGHTVIVPDGDAPWPPVELRLDPSGTLRGTVRAPNGAAVEDATVYAIPADQPELLAKRYASVVSGGRRWTAAVAHTDALGRYELEGLMRAGAYVAFAAAEGWACSQRREGVLVTDATPSADSDFVLRRFGALLVHVVDADGAPRPAQVTVATIGPEPFQSPTSRRTDERGTFRLDDMEPAPYRIWTMTPDAPHAATRVEVGEGATVEITVQQARGVAIAGVVVDDRGEPLENVDVRIASPRPSREDEPQPSEGRARTGRDGRFRIEGLRTGPHGVDATSADHANLPRTSFDAPAEDVRLVMPRCGSATLRLVAPAGREPPAFVDILRGAMTRPSQGADGEWHDYRSGSTNHLGRGRISLSGLVPGPCRIRIVSLSFAPVERRFDVALGDTTDLGDVPLDPGLELAGRVEDLVGAPVAGAHVRTGDRFTIGFQDVATTADGSFRLTRLAAGRNEVTVAAQGFLVATIDADVAPGCALLIVRLARARGR